MDDNERLEALLDRWEAAREEGQEAAPAELCRDCPELLAALTERIWQLTCIEQLLFPVADDTGQQNLDSPTTATSDAPPHQLGRYQLQRLVGKGGFGSVWRAYDPALRRAVAVKVLSCDAFSRAEEVERFQAEAQKLAQLRHPRIVPVYDVGHNEGRWYLVSELVEGTNLSQLIHGRRPRWAESCRIVAQVAWALGHAHQRGIVHRDVKPANILIDVVGEPFLSDFGIAATLDELHDDVARLSGTLAYMSPEQRRMTGPIDARSDIYSLGLVLYELLVADPRSGDKAPADPLPSPRSIDRSIPSAVDKVCRKAIAQSPAERYALAEEFAQALERALEAPVRRKRITWTCCGAVCATMLAIWTRNDGRTLPSAAPVMAEAASTKSGQRDDPPLTKRRPARPVQKAFRVLARQFIGNMDVGLSPAADTGIVVEEGQRISVTATGAWRVGPLERHIGGPRLLRIAIGTADALPQQYVEGDDCVEFTAKHSGHIFLGCVDSSPNDNSGELEVQLDVR